MRKLKAEIIKKPDAAVLAKLSCGEKNILLCQKQWEIVLKRKNVSGKLKIAIAKLENKIGKKNRQKWERKKKNKLSLDCSTVKPQWLLVLEILECSWFFFVLELFLKKYVFPSLVVEYSRIFSILWIFWYCMKTCVMFQVLRGELWHLCLTIGFWIFCFHLNYKLAFTKLI